jgi:hypothetical protein
MSNKIIIHKLIKNLMNFIKKININENKISVVYDQIYQIQNVKNN